MSGTLFKAALEGDEEEVRRHLSLGSPVNEENAWLETALHLAAERGHASIVELLLSAYGRSAEARCGCGWC
jgi:ankyrin repeat protein